MQARAALSCEFLDRFDELGDTAAAGDQTDENDFLDLLARSSMPRRYSCRSGRPKRP